MCLCRLQVLSLPSLKCRWRTNGSPRLISFFPYHKFSLVIFSKHHQSQPSHLPLPTTSASVTGSNYDSTIYCISTSETTKEALIFQAKGTWESTKSISAQLRSEERDTAEERASPSLVPAPFEEGGWKYKQGARCLLSYRCQCNHSDTGPFLLLVTFSREMDNNRGNMTLFSLSFF